MASEHKLLSNQSVISYLGILTLMQFEIKYRLINNLLTATTDQYRYRDHNCKSQNKA